jgi:prepilin-type processing-associated H-X9-DG protein
VNNLGGNLWPEDSVWRCPSASSYNSGDTNSYYTIAYNWLYLTDVDPSNGFIPDWSSPEKYGIWSWTQPGRSLASVTSPSETVLMADAGHSDGPHGTRATWSTLLSPLALASNGPSDWLDAMDARHNETADIIWLDGHVKPMKLEAVYGRWDKTTNPPTFRPPQDPPDKFFDLN